MKNDLTVAIPLATWQVGRSGSGLALMHGHSMSGMAPLAQIARRHSQRPRGQRALDKVLLAATFER